MTGTFAAGEEKWRARLGTLRQVVRQHLVSRQLAGHLADRPGQRILDIGCGQGSQLLVLARGGHLLTGLDSSAALLADLGRSLRAEPPEVRDRVRLVQGDALRAAELLERRGSTRCCATACSCTCPTRPRCWPPSRRSPGPAAWSRCWSATATHSPCDLA